MAHQLDCTGFFALWINIHSLELRKSFYLPIHFSIARIGGVRGQTVEQPHYTLPWRHTEAMYRFLAGRQDLQVLNSDSARYPLDTYTLLMFYRDIIIVNFCHLIYFEIMYFTVIICMCSVCPCTKLNYIITRKCIYQ